ncbi:MAG: flavodoxin family protein [Desulfuromonadales bacterium]|nr:flavodoxin family protein [Desulfuromonadales bacterium]
MKIVAFNGSPHMEGNTFYAINLVAAELEKAGIDTEIIQVGNKPIQGCTACGMCIKNQDERCVLKGDDVNAWIQAMKGAEGILLGSPVHFAGVGGAMKSFLDRAFYVSGVNGNLLRHKVGAAVVAVRRSGGLPTFEQLNNFLLYSELLLPTSNYWNVIHGTRPGDAAQDVEGVQIMRILGRNMAWLMKLIENGQGTVIPPQQEAKTFMNFIR